MKVYEESIGILEKLLIKYVDHLFLHLYSFYVHPHMGWLRNQIIPYRGCSLPLLSFNP